MTEKALQKTICAMARAAGWKVFHVTDSRGSPAGWPDLVLAHRARGRLLFRELKTDTGRVSKAQREWLEDLRAGGADADIWLERDLRSGRVERELGVDLQEAPSAIDVHLQ